MVRPGEIGRQRQPYPGRAPTDLIVARPITMRYWWVNQNQTYRAEVRGSFMRSPKLTVKDARHEFYDNIAAPSQAG
jgi:hypothetical protein